MQSLPVVVIGSGPVGLAAAAHLVLRGESPVVLEAGPDVASGVLSWAHVRTFSPWRYTIDEAARTLLERACWTAPDLDGHPTGHDLVESYLRPLAGTPELRPLLRLNSRVESIARQGIDKLKSSGRAETPFELTVATPSGREVILARAVIDASGTVNQPNPLGANGLPALGEAAASRIRYGIPEVLGRDRELYAGKRVAVVGSGHSAFNALLELARLREAEPATEIHWAIRRRTFGNLFGGGANDQLEERGRLGTGVEALVRSGHVNLHTGVRVREVNETAGAIQLQLDGAEFPEVDQVIVATGFRPNLEMTRELRLQLDETVESPVALAPLIDPNLHSCGTVPPHGAEQLAHPEPNFYTIGMKSYGRAPTFLMLTGYEQARSVVAAIVGDMEAAREVRLVLPETGVCSSDAAEAASTCCGSSNAAPAPVVEEELRLAVV